MSGPSAETLLFRKAQRSCSQPVHNSIPLSKLPCSSAGLANHARRSPTVQHLSITRQHLAASPPTLANIGGPSDMGNTLARTESSPAQNADEVGARELGLKNNLKLAEVNTLIDYYKRKDPDNKGLLPEQFQEVAGGFFASGLTIDPKIIFTIFDTAEGGVTGRVTLREFILGYAILCRGTAEGRLRYLFAVYGNVEGDGYLTRDQLISSLKLMQRIVNQVTAQEVEVDEEENDKQIKAVADDLIAASSDPQNKGISYEDFIEKVTEVEVVTLWLDDLSSVAGEHMKYIEKRELDVVELHMERQGLLTSDSQAPLSVRSGVDWVRTSGSDGVNPAGSSSATDRRWKIPLPKKYKLVRRDLNARYTGRRSMEPSQSPDDDESTLNEAYAAKPFVINYDQIEFGKILGRGACATVYQCEWLHVPVAVKVFNDRQGEAAGIDKLATSYEEMRKNVVGDYVEEFWLLLQIRHPNCLLYMGICFEPVVCIITELYSGGSVANFLHGPNPSKFAPEQAIEMMSGVARGMLYLHASSPPILHRDLKASNILINRNISHCVICDFGLSSQFVNEASGINTSQDGQSGAGVVGTPYTMAPEIMQGKPYTPAADVYSFGVVIYEMYTGRFPFPRMKPVQLMFFVTEGGRPKFHESDNIPPTLKELIERCWANDKDTRPTFEEILRVLTSAQLSKEISCRQNGADKNTEHNENSEDTSESDLSKRLLEAAYRGHTDKAAKLIDKGAMVNYGDYDKRTALHVGKYPQKKYETQNCTPRPQAIR